jgi:23S rRNA pseudouridine2605 synthase
VKSEEQPVSDKEGKIRIGKLLARAGLVSRRGAAEFLEAHQVCFDGKRITDLNFYVNEAGLGEHSLTVDGKIISFAAASEVLLYNKPRGLVCSHKHQKERGKELRTIFDALPRDYAAWFFAGRLDVNSEGLMVLSNDGDHIYALSHPSQRVLKKYRVQTTRPLSPAEITRCLKGVIDKGEKLKFEKIEPGKIPAEYEVWLREGKNREIRRLIERLGVFIRKLTRLELGPYQLGELPSGAYQLVSKIDPHQPNAAF